MADTENIRSLTGSTRNGAPLATARAASEDLLPWLNWISVSEAELPANHTVECGMLCDQPCLRLLYGGNWTAHDKDGPKLFKPGTKGVSLYFGPQTRFMPLSVTGSFKAITLHFSSGAGVLGGPAQADILDRVINFDAMVGRGRLTSKIPLDENYESWIRAIEAELRFYLEKFGSEPPHRITRRFERACLAGPDFNLGRFAEAQEISLKTLQRIVKRDFGVTPSLVRRRARALDIAASLMGVALPEEEASMGLRYFDQAHQIKEIRKFFDRKPSDLINGQNPLLRITLESRQRRRLQALQRLGDIDQLPWRDPQTEPCA